MLGCLDDATQKGGTRSFTLSITSSFSTFEDITCFFLIKLILFLIGLSTFILELSSVLFTSFCSTLHLQLVLVKRQNWQISRFRMLWSPWDASLSSTGSPSTKSKACSSAWLTLSRESSSALVLCLQNSIALLVSLLLLRRQYAQAIPGFTGSPILAAANLGGEGLMRV